MHLIFIPASIGIEVVIVVNYEFWAKPSSSIKTKLNIGRDGEWIRSTEASTSAEFTRS